MSKNTMAKQTCELFQSLNLWLSLCYWESFKSQKILDFRWKWISKVQLLWIVVMEKNQALSSSHFSETAFISLSCGTFPWEVSTWHSPELGWTLPAQNGAESPLLLQAVHSPCSGVGSSPDFCPLHTPSLGQKCANHCLFDCWCLL